MIRFFNAISKVICNSGLSSSTAPAINYYISNSGNINNNGLTPETAITPEGIPNLNLQVRSNLNFNCGEIFSISLIISNDNISIKNYGSGAKPIFTGSTDISSLTWIDNGDGTFYTTMLEPNWIYISGQRAKISETPWITVTGYPATNQFVINNADVSAYGTITGSRLFNLPRVWTTEYLYSVSNYVSGTGTITINQATVYQTNIIGTTLKLCGKKSFFVSNQEWAWEGGKLYIKSTVNPSTLNIRASAYTVGVTIPDGINNTVIDGIEFTDYYYSGIKIGRANNTTITNCTIHNSNGYGVAGLKNSTVRTIANCTIYDCNGGIYDSASINVQFQNNSIYNIGMGLNYGFMVDYDLAGHTPNRGICMFAIEANGYSTSSGDISYNILYNIAYLGIGLQGTNVKCHHNIVHDFLQIFSDGGGIYCVGHTDYTASSMEIYFNIVYDGGNVSNCIGLYMDARTITANIHDNTIYNVPTMGIFFNAGTGHCVAVNNIVVDCGATIQYRQNDSIPSIYPNNIGNISTGNVLALRKTSEYCHKAEEFDGTINYNPFYGGGSSNGNYYISPYINRIAYNTAQVSMTIAQMRTRYSTDAGSTEWVNWKTYVNPSQAELDVKLYTNETNTPVIQSVGAGYIDINGNSVSYVTVPAYGGVVVLLYP